MEVAVEQLGKASIVWKYNEFGKKIAANLG